MRETVFNLLGSSVVGSTVLDLFAGVGTLGIEALSRGAVEVHFVENNRTALRYLRRNLDTIGAADDTAVYAGDAFRVMKKLFAQGRKYDLVFCDPPYGEDLSNRVLSFEGESPVVKERGALILQHHVKDEIDWPSSRYDMETQRTLGDTFLSILTAG
jgi:16S rRNA (guanine(966)-N(2))-methyltransferase RsmD